MRWMRLYLLNFLHKCALPQSYTQFRKWIYFNWIGRLAPLWCRCGFDYFIVDIFAKSKQICAFITFGKINATACIHLCIVCVLNMCSAVGKNNSQNIKSNNNTTEMRKLIIWLHIVLWMSRVWTRHSWIDTFVLVLIFFLHSGLAFCNCWIFVCGKCILMLATVCICVLSTHNCNYFRLLHKLQWPKNYGKVNVYPRNIMGINSSHITCAME